MAHVSYYDPDLRTTVSVQDNAQGHALLARWQEDGRTYRKNRETCARMLRNGYEVDAVLVDDGWVDRRANTVSTGGEAIWRGQVEVGSMIALGHVDTRGAVIGRFRICRVTEVSGPGPLMAIVDPSHRTYTFVEEVAKFDLVGPEPM